MMMRVREKVTVASGCGITRLSQPSVLIVQQTGNSLNAALQKSR